MTAKTEFLTCKKCEYEWVPRRPDPVACPRCKRYDYREPVTSAKDRETGGKEAATP